jgi:hypothetical protein
VGMNELLSMLACVLPDDNRVPNFAQAKRAVLRESVQYCETPDSVLFLPDDGL